MILLSTSTLGEIMLYTLVAITVVLLFFTISAVIKTRRLVREHGIDIFSGNTNYVTTFLIMLVLAVGVMYLVKIGLENNIGVLNYLVFSVFPYIALITFLIGSIYRYRATGFQVSSLSSQFLERKKLFWGSQAFHWGLLVLFFGHLIAFMFPRAVLAWNGEPVRLIILEVTAFVFGLFALAGLVLLIRRRLTSDRVLMVTNKMDILVYVTLFIQILSGLGVAYYARWGSSWFASVLTPYLRSIFAFNPDIAAVSAMPWVVQIHIFSAFLIIAIIPFSRFMHFLVAPVDYSWRRYQLVIWNWNKKSIRKSGVYQYGKKSKNN